MGLKLVQDPFKKCEMFSAKHSKTRNLETWSFLCFDIKLKQEK